jgi:hypothetical protein
MPFRKLNSILQKRLDGPLAALSHTDAGSATNRGPSYCGGDR